MPAAITLLVVLEFGFVGLCLAWGPAEDRRSRFWIHVALTCLAIPAFAAVLFAVKQLNMLSDDVATKLLQSLMLIGIGALVCIPSLFYRKPNSAPDSSAPDGDGGIGPPPPRFSPDPSGGGIPLADADQASTRARDHGTPKFAGLKRRRPAHEPQRIPVRGPQ